MAQMTPRASVTSGTQGLVTTTPVTTAAINAIRANSYPVNYDGPTEHRRRDLPPYKAARTNPTAYASEPFKDGGR